MISGPIVLKEDTPFYENQSKRMNPVPDVVFHHQRC